MTNDRAGVMRTLSVNAMLIPSTLNDLMIARPILQGCLLSMLAFSAMAAVPGELDTASADSDRSCRLFDEGKLLATGGGLPTWSAVRPTVP